MFQRSSSSGQRPSSSPPSAVLITDEGYSSASSEDDPPCHDSVSQDGSYGISNDVSKQGKKGRQPKRSVIDQLRLCFLTGRLSRLVLQGIMLVCVGLVTHAISTKIHAVLSQESAVSNFGLTPKPTMLAVYFKDVSSHGPTGKIRPLSPPKTNKEWVRMLGKQSQQRHRHHPTGPVLLAKVEPISQRLDSIEEGSEYYEDEKPELTPNPDECTPQYDWQTTTFPACNSIHENTMMWDRMYQRPIAGSSTREDQQQLDPHHEHGHQHHNHHHHHHHPHEEREDNGNQKQLRRRRHLLEKPRKTSTNELQQQYRVLAHGYWRDTWMMNNTPNNELVAFKTMRMQHELSEYLMDKQRRDAVASDRVTFSRQAIQMYGYCGTSALYEYAPGGDLEELVDSFESAKDWTRYYSSTERLVLAYNVTCALADLHTTEGRNTPAAIVHGDFKSDQFVAVTKEQQPHKLPHFKLGDFNLARFVYWNEKYHHPCVVKPDGNGGANRAPEEYNGDKGRTEKLDIYSLGNVLYTILTGHFPFDDLKDGDASTAEKKELVKKGRRPHVNIDADIRHSKDPLEQAMLAAVELCWKQDPHDRPAASEVEAVLAEHVPREFQRAHPRPIRDMGRRHLQ